MVSMTPVQHVSVVIERSADLVDDYAADPANLPDWAAGLADTAVERTAEGWVANSPRGRVVVDFAEHNDFGVLDHVVTMDSGERVHA